MFDYEEYYKLYNDKAEGKYRELKAFLTSFSQELSARSDKGFRERMLNFSRQQAAFLCELTRIEEKYSYEYLKTASIQSLKEDQQKLFGDLFPDTYQNSCCNPSYMITMGGKDVGPVLSTFAHIFKEGIMDAFFHRRFRLLSKIELYFDLHKRLLHGQVRADQLTDMAASFRLKQGEVGMELGFHQMFDPGNQYYTAVVREEDMREPYYLYSLGLPVVDEALRLHDFYCSLPEETLDKISEALVSRLLLNENQGGRRFLVAVSIPLGSEILGKRILKKIEEKGLSGFINEIHPIGFSDKYVRDHRHDMFRGMNEEEQHILAEKYEVLCQENQALLNGSLGMIRVSYMDPLFRERGPRGKKESLLKDQHDNLMFNNAQALLKARGGMYPVLELSVPVFSKEEGQDYAADFDFWMTHQLFHELPSERSGQTVLNALSSGTSLYFEGRNGNLTDLTVGLTMTESLQKPDKQIPYMTLLRNAGQLPCGEILIHADELKINGTLHVDSIFFQGRVFEDVRILFEDGMVRQVSMGEEGREESKYLDRWQSLRLSRIIMGLNMDLLESLYGKEDIPVLPEALTKQSCLSFVLGPESTAAFPYENVRLISALREDDTFSDVMREGLFMPVGADSMNLALMRIYQNK